MDPATSGSQIQVDAQGNPTNNAHATKSVVRGEALMHNMKQLDLFNIVIYMAAGTIAGILGLTGLEGLYLLIIVALLTSLGLMLRMQFNVLQFTTVPLGKLVFSGLSSQCMTYILFWTFAFALVHLY